jgi:hypothetical protein
MAGVRWHNKRDEESRPGPGGRVRPARAACVPRLARQIAAGPSREAREEKRARVALCGSARPRQWAGCNSQPTSSSMLPGRQFDALRRHKSKPRGVFGHSSYFRLAMLRVCPLAVDWLVSQPPVGRRRGRHDLRDSIFSTGPGASPKGLSKRFPEGASQGRFPEGASQSASQREIPKALPKGVFRGAFQGDFQGRFPREISKGDFQGVSVFNRRLPLPGPRALPWPLKPEKSAEAFLGYDGFGRMMHIPPRCAEARHTRDGGLVVRQYRR